jgi:hypothetical protein
MVVLADELLESFFDTDLTESWKLEMQVVETPLRTGFLGGIINALVTDENKERLNRLADAVGRQLEIQSGFRLRFRVETDAGFSYREQTGDRQDGCCNRNVGPKDSRGLNARSLADYLSDYFSVSLLRPCMLQTHSDQIQRPLSIGSNSTDQFQFRPFA